MEIGIFYHEYSIFCQDYQVWNIEMNLFNLVIQNVYYSKFVIQKIKLIISRDPIASSCHIINFGPPISERARFSVR